MDAWLTHARDVLAAAAGIEPSELELSSHDERTLLDLARIAAHDSGARINAPLLCYLVGRAAERGETTLEGLAEPLRRDSA